MKMFAKKVIFKYLTIDRLQEKFVIHVSNKT
jgi:hypothetical protein